MYMTEALRMNITYMIVPNTCMSSADTNGTSGKQRLKSTPGKNLAGNLRRIISRALFTCCREPELKYYCTRRIKMQKL